MGGVCVRGVGGARAVVVLVVSGVVANERRAEVCEECARTEMSCCGVW